MSDGSFLDKDYLWAIDALYKSWLGSTGTEDKVARCNRQDHKVIKLRFFFVFQFYSFFQESFVKQLIVEKTGGHMDEDYNRFKNAVVRIVKRVTSPEDDSD